MILNLGSALFNAETLSGGGTPAWGTEMGQGNGYRFNFEGYQEFITALVYNSIPNPQSRIDCPLGKGGKQAADYEFVLASMFNKIFVNGEKVDDAKFILLVVKKLVGANHVGRRTLKYNPRITLDNNNYNAHCYDLIATKLGVTSTGSWFISEINVKNQDELHFTAHSLDANVTFTFKNTEHRSKTLASKIKAYAESKQHNNLIRFSEDVLIARSLQQIFYGAPGTGKSHKIKEQLEGVSKENIFRTTFHPDSDYSSFVGCFKPSMEKSNERLYSKEELINKLTELKEQGATYVPQKFGAKYWCSLKQLTPQDKKDILLACEMSDNYIVEFDKGIAVGEEYLKSLNESRIIYRYTPQVFLKAYMQAYRTTDNVYLIVEEINRGNCAQIFGDLFQLLDRDANGKSEYTIKADDDLKAFLEEELGKDSEAIKDGELCLPSNLYIWATMNTSDQSLFPIDSAFKRRWDWEYEPIKYKNIDWVINIEGSKFLWTSFQREINKRIFDATNSEDKMLGDYFVNPADGVITEKILLNKILFYLWNDVCKDGEGDIFKTADNEDVTFSDLHSDGGKDKLIAMMKYLKVEEA